MADALTKTPSAHRESCRQARSNPGDFSSSTRGPETDFGEIAPTVPFAPDPFSKDVLEADFWPGTTSGLPVMQA